MFTRTFLIKIRKKALRRGVFFKVLDPIERGILRLVPLVVERIKSQVLGITLLKIIRKISDSLKSSFVRGMEVFGLKQAIMLSALAVSWGYIKAMEWTSEYNFIKYLTLLNVNSP